jgi:DNA-binding response OmpR family regulator
METSSGLMAESVHRILVIDDELDHTEIVAALLRREGYAVEVATDARQGIERACDDPPDLILLDLWMPTVDGFKAAQLLRSDARTRRVPVIFLSACGEVVAEANQIHLEEMEYLAKPFHAVELLEMAAAALRK